MERSTSSFNHLLHLLASQDYVSGEWIGQELGISRSGVWKQLQQLREVGVPIDSIRGRGHRLGFDALSASGLEKSLSVTGAPVQVEHHFSIDSTNQRALSLEGPLATPHLIVAEQQTAGRGRRGRDWHSPWGENLYFSYAFDWLGPIEKLSGLSLVVGLAVADVVSTQVGISGVGLKWPNDVLVNGKKTSGILIELQGRPDEGCRVVVGVGVNVNMQASDLQASQVIDQPWTSLAIERGRRLERLDCLVKLVKSIQLHLVDFFEAGLEGMVSCWNQYDIFAGENVTQKGVAEPVQGVGMGVDVSGAYQVMLDGNIEKITIGELSGGLALLS